MVICIQDDGWQWSKTEQGSGYQIVKMPGVPKEDLAKWELPAFEDDADPHDSPMWRRRRWVIDITKLTKTVTNNLENTLTPDATRIAALEAVTNDKKKLTLGP
jgi:hypothetical protein